MKPHSKKLVGEICNYLGQDIDHPMCQELMQHVNECPECRDYIESVKMTVRLLRESEKSEPIPQNVKDDLFRKLNLNV